MFLLTPTPLNLPPKKSLATQLGTTGAQLSHFHTHTLSLVIHWVSEIQKKPAKKYISIQGGELKLRKPSILMVPEFHTLFFFFFPERLRCCCYIDFHCSYLYTATIIPPLEPLCIRCAEIQRFVLSFSISY